MTIAESVAKAAASLPPDKQQEVLDFVEFLAQRNAVPSQRATPTLDSVKQALAAAAGIWKDRTDLPTDSAAAAQSLRDRAASRGGQ